MDDVTQIPDMDPANLKERVVAKVREEKSFAAAYNTALNAENYGLGMRMIYAISQEILDPFEPVLEEVFHTLLERAGTADECRMCWNLAIARSNEKRIALEDLAYKKARSCAKNDEEMEEIEKLLS